MGNLLIHKGSNRHQDFHQTIKHPQFGSIKVVDSFKKSYMQIQFPQCESLNNKWKQNLKQIENTHTDYLLFPIHIQQEKQGLCGAGPIIVQYQAYPYILSEEIMSRKQKEKMFKQTQLWLLLYFLLQAHEEIQICNIEPSESIHPKQIFLNKEGSIKVANSLSWPYVNKDSSKPTEDRSFYISAQLLKNQQIIHKINKPANNQSFEIGLTILSAANLQLYNYLYQSKGTRFDETEFIRILNEWKRNNAYSQIFKATVSGLLELSVEERIGLKQMQTWLQTHRTSILSKTRFVIHDVPKKVLRQIQLIQTLKEHSRH